MATFLDRSVPDVLTLRDLATLVQRNPRYFEKLCALQKRTGQQLLPEQIQGLGYRFTKEAVEKWLRRGIPDLEKLRRVS